MFKEAIKNNSREIIFIQCALNSNAVVFKDEINTLLNEKSKSLVVYSALLERDSL